MSTSPKLLVLVLLIVGAMVFLVARSTGSSTGNLYYLEVDEFVAHPVEGDLRLAGWVREGSIEKTNTGLVVRFLLTDEAREKDVPVVYDSRKGGGRIPDTFRDGSQVVVSGRMGPDGTFVATRLLAKCPSKYEVDPADRAARAP